MSFSKRQGINKLQKLVSTFLSFPSIPFLNELYHGPWVVLFVFAFFCHSLLLSIVLFAIRYDMCSIQVRKELNWTLFKTLFLATLKKYFVIFVIWSVCYFLFLSFVFLRSWQYTLHLIPKPWCYCLNVSFIMILTYFKKTCKIKQ